MNFDVIIVLIFDGAVTHATSYSIIVLSLFVLKEYLVKAVILFMIEINIVSSVSVSKERRPFFGFCAYDLISTFNQGLKIHLHEGLLNSNIYGNVLHKLRRIVTSTNFSEQFKRTVA